MRMLKFSNERTLSYSSFLTKNDTNVLFICNMIWTQVSVFILLIINSWAHDHEFITDYFEYKEVSSVVGVYTCENANDDVRLIRKFNDNGISATIIKWNSHSSNLTVNSLYRKFGIFLDLRCLIAKDIVHLFSKFASYTYLHSWLIISSNLEETLKLVNDTSFSVMTDFMIAISKNNTYTLYDIFNFCKYRGGILNVTFSGSWSAKTKLNITILKDPIARRPNLHGMTLLMTGLINNRPKNVKLVDYLQDYTHKTLDILGKYTYILWLHVSDMFNFTIEPGEFTEWKLGDKNGPMIAALIKKEIDLAGTPAQMTVERLGYVSAPTSPWPFRTTFMFLTTPSKDIKINEFLSPFAAECWYLTIFLIFLSIISFAVFLTSEEISNAIERYSISFLLIFGSLCQQGAAVCPTNAAGRIGFLSIMIFSLLMYNYYSASLVSARLNEPLDKMNDSMASLTKSNLKIAVEKQIYFIYFLQRTDWEITLFRSRFLALPESERYLRPEEGIKRITKGDFAYHTEPNTGYPIIERTFDNRQICQLTEVNFVHTTHMPLFVRKDSPFLEMATRGMAKIYSTGIRHRQLNRWKSRSPLCRKEILIVDSITIYETAPALILLVFGIIISTMICIIENFLFYHLKNSRRNEVRNFSRLDCCHLIKKNFVS